MGTTEGCVKDYLTSNTGLDNCKFRCGWVVGCGWVVPFYFKSSLVLAIDIFAARLFLSCSTRCRSRQPRASLCRLEHCLRTLGEGTMATRTRNTF
jgi:hypothetical protein